MKRSQALQPLSRDHFVALTIALRLTRGKPENLKTNWPTNEFPSKQAQRAMKIFEKDLLDHFKEEEDILFAKIKQFLQTDEEKKVLEQILDQHQEFYALFAELDSGDDEIIRQRLENTGDLLERHVRIEERELFPVIEKNTPEDILDELGEKLKLRDRFDCSTLL